MEVSDIKVGQTIECVRDGAVVAFVVTRVGGVHVRARGSEATEVVDLTIRGDDGLERAAEYSNEGSARVALDLGGLHPLMVTSVR